MHRFRAQLHTSLCLGALVGLLLGSTACAEDEEGSVDTLPARSTHEALLAEEIEVLLPGIWAWEGSTPAESDNAASLEISIVFLGHDAATGNVALLVETDTPQGDETLIQAARVELDDTLATLHLTNPPGSYLLERIQEDTLVVQDTQTATRLVYRRIR